MSQDLEILITPDGNGRCVYGEAIELSQLGALTLTRASSVEPDGRARWRADLSAVGGPCLGPFLTRSQALAAESRWLAEHWLTAHPHVPGTIASGKSMSALVPATEVKPPCRR